MSLCPLVVDLDGTLIHTDMLHESALRALRDRPLSVLAIPLWLAQGKAVLKQKLVAHGVPDAAALPYNEEFLGWLKEQKASGRYLVLCTASDRSIAEAIAGHLGVFDEVIASDGTINVAGENKARVLEERFGKGQFDYAGNSSADLVVWKSARHAIVVNASSGTARQARAGAQVEREFLAPKAGALVYLKMLRVHQWLKNLLLFIPLLAAHQVENMHVVGSLLLAFMAFSLCASTVYISNDLLDLESDRLHPRKRRRPFASGAIPVWQGVIFAPLLLLMSAGLCTLLTPAFSGWLLVYFILTCAYSWGLKRLIIVDCVALALLYTLRIIAGAAAISMDLSFWLLAFAVFLFLSLAFVKRYAEIEQQIQSGKEKVHGRGYRTSDAQLIQTMGIAAGYASALVLALYISSDAVVELYRAPEVVWGAVPVMLFWVSWMWVQAHRGNMHDDPLVFAVKDKASLLAGALFAAIIIVGTIGAPWLR